MTLLLRVPSFVTTLGTLFLLNGITLTLSAGRLVDTPGSPRLQACFGHRGYSEILWAVLLAVIMHTVLRARGVPGLLERRSAGTGNGPSGCP